MTSEAHPLVIDSTLEIAARLLAWGKGHQDGWCSVEQAARLRDASGDDMNLAMGRWRRQLSVLLRERPEVRVVIEGADGYPANLSSVSGRPSMLFVDGTILTRDHQALAVVGSRKVEEAAAAAAADIGSRLALLGYTVVSGLARGVDTAGHKGALAAGGRTIAVVGTGIDEVFPPENGGLVSRIRRSGALVSQFPPGYGPTKTTFPARNAVIAGLSLGSIVVTASERSGTRIEIDRTLAQGRPVFLWKPFLGHDAWARRLAADPLVHLVGSVDEIDDIVRRTSRA